MNKMKFVKLSAIIYGGLYIGLHIADRVGERWARKHKVVIVQKYPSALSEEELNADNW